MKKERNRIQGKGYKKKDANEGGTGFSLIEMLVVVFVFSVLGVVSTQILALSLRSAKKSESIIEVKSNLEYTLSNMERLLRNAKNIEPSTTTKLNYKDSEDRLAWFECVTSGTDTYIASGSSLLGTVRVTANDVIVNCVDVFEPIYYDEGSGMQDMVTIELTGVDAELGAGVEGASVTVSTQVKLRSY